MGIIASVVSNGQKQIERQHLHSFRHLRGDFPAGELIEGETPDFLVITPTGRKIGIEHTQVFKKTGADEISEQADETTKDFITNGAKGHAESLGLPPAYVSLFFNTPYLRRTVGTKRRSLTNAQKHHVAKGIAEFVGVHMPPQGGSVRCDWRPGQPRQVDLILINRVRPPDRHNWRWLEMNKIEDDAIDLFQHAITKKNKVCVSCFSKCDECWLLVVADSFQSSGTIHPDEASLSHVYTSRFDRIYFLDLALRRVARLNIESGS
ncbi:MAG TPA: hypothetical protein VM755_05160 [Stellaceae bacterium]|nr:hypothetical protein [Stellaceae bacterium]